MFDTDEDIEKFFKIFEKSINNVNWEKVQLPINLSCLDEDSNRRYRESYAERKYMDTLFQKF
jgi:hypothetical protein